MGVDVVGPDLGGTDTQSGAKRFEESKGDRGFADPRCRSGDDQPSRAQYSIPFFALIPWS